MPPGESSHNLAAAFYFMSVIIYCQEKWTTATVLNIEVCVSIYSFNSRSTDREALP